MELKLIALVGNSRVGKDETAKILQKDFGFEQRAMADGIREILLGLNPILKDNGGVVWELLDLYDQCHGDWDRIKALSTESVDLMINLGQSCRDVLGETCWLDRVLPRGVELETKVVISDCRQPNEYHAIKERGGQIWKVTRSGTLRRGMDGLLDHLDFDARIKNDGSLEDLRSMVQAVITGQQPYQEDEPEKLVRLNNGKLVVEEQ